MENLFSKYIHIVSYYSNILEGVSTLTCATNASFGDVVEVYNKLGEKVGSLVLTPMNSNRVEEISLKKIVDIELNSVNSSNLLEYKLKILENNVVVFESEITKLPIYENNKIEIEHVYGIRGKVVVKGKSTFTSNQEVEIFVIDEETYISLNVDEEPQNLINEINKETSLLSGIKKYTTTCSFNGNWNFVSPEEHGVGKKIIYVMVNRNEINQCVDKSSFIVRSNDTPFVQFLNSIFIYKKNSVNKIYGISNVIEGESIKVFLKRREDQQIINFEGYSGTVVDGNLGYFEAIIPNNIPDGVYIIGVKLNDIDTMFPQIFNEWDSNNIFIKTTTAPETPTPSGFYYHDNKLSFYLTKPNHDNDFIKYSYKLTLNDRGSQDKDKIILLEDGNNLYSFDLDYNKKYMYYITTIDPCGNESENLKSWGLSTWNPTYSTPNIENQEVMQRIVGNGEFPKQPLVGFEGWNYNNSNPNTKKLSWKIYDYLASEKQMKLRDFKDIYVGVKDQVSSKIPRIVIYTKPKNESNPYSTKVVLKPQSQEYFNSSEKNMLVYSSFGVGVFQFPFKDEDREKTQVYFVIDKELTHKLNDNGIKESFENSILERSANNYNYIFLLFGNTDLHHEEIMSIQLESEDSESTEQQNLYNFTAYRAGYRAMFFDISSDDTKLDESGAILHNIYWNYTIPPTT